MSIVAQLIVNGLIAGSIYALVACGFSLIYSTNRFMHFAHGVAITIASYLLYLFFSMLELPFTLACLLTLIGAGLYGYLVELLVYLPMRSREASNVILLMASVALLLFFENLVLLIFGADVKTIGLIKVAKGMEILGAIITPLQLTIVLVSVVLFLGLWLFMNKTKLGRNMRAVADNPELASIIGINEKKVTTLSFVIGSVLAGIGGILIGLEQNLEPTMGTALMIKGFAGSVIGGVTSVPASIIGSYLVGLAENLGIWYLPSGYKDAIAFVIMFIFLLVRPMGLFGKETGVRK